MELRKMYLKQLGLLLEELKKVDIENLFRLENFKLYDVAYIANDDDFNDFCYDSWEFFNNEILKDNRCKLIQFNRTSSNYIISEFDNIDYYDRDILRLGTYSEKLEAVFNDFIEYYLVDDIRVQIKDGNIVDFYDEDYVDDEFLEENFIYESMFEHSNKDIKEFIEDNINSVNRVYQYIEDFKENQVEYFKEFIQ